jgi:hypothetical protein
LVHNKNKFNIFRAIKTSTGKYSFLCLLVKRNQLFPVTVLSTMYLTPSSLDQINRSKINKQMDVIIQHLYFTQTLLSVAFHDTCHPTDNIDATRTSSHYTRRETVTGHIPPTHVTDD